MKDLTIYDTEKYRDDLHDLAKLKAKPLELLYSGKAIMFLYFKEHESTFDVKCVDNEEKPDCYISSFAANMWFRTGKGTNIQKYKSFSIMLREIKRRSKQLELTPIGYKLTMDKTERFSFKSRKDVVFNTIKPFPTDKCNKIWS